MEQATSWRRRLPRLAAPLLLALAPLAASCADLTVEVTNIKSNAGRLLVALYNRPEGFPGSNIFRGEDIAPVPGTAKVVFRGLPPGTYAVTAFHDLDNNKKLKTNGLGIPMEPLAFSRDARGVNGPPTFSDASIQIGAAPAQMTLKLR